MPKPIKQIAIDALIKEVEKGSDRSMIVAKYCKEFQKSARTIDTYWKIANEQHVIKQQSIKKEIEIVDKQAAIEARKKAIMTADERKEWLTKMIVGEMKAKIPFVIAGKIMEYPSDPNHSDRLKALAELNKMEGDYSPLKVAQTDKSGNDISNVPIFQNVPAGYVFGMLPSNTDGEDEQ